MKIEDTHPLSKHAWHTRLQREHVKRPSFILVQNPQDVGEEGICGREGKASFPTVK
jgi:hypothetical protein